MGYDVERTQLVVFGGKGSRLVYGDTWVLSLDTLTWRNVTSPVPKRNPSARFDMVHRAARELRVTSDAYVYTQTFTY